MTNKLHDLLPESMRQELESAGRWADLQSMVEERADLYEAEIRRRLRIDEWIEGLNKEVREDAWRMAFEDIVEGRDEA